MSDSLWPHGLYSPWNSPGLDTGVGSLSLLQRIFPTQGSNPGLLYCRWILHQLSHKRSPRILEWVAYPFSSRSSQPRNWTGVSSTAGNSLPTELWGKPSDWTQPKVIRASHLDAEYHEPGWFSHALAIETLRKPIPFTTSQTGGFRRAPGQRCDGQCRKHFPGNCLALTVPFYFQLEMGKISLTLLHGFAR